MTIVQLIHQLVYSNAVFARSRGVIVDIDVESAGDFPIPAVALFDILNNVFVHAIESSPTGGQVSISAIHTNNGLEIEIADSSDLTSDSVSSGSFVVAKSERDLRRIGGQFCVLNCPQGGVAYSMTVPQSIRAAA